MKQLKSLNTFGVSAQAKEWHPIKNFADWHQVIKKHAHEPLLIWGGGSNLLPVEDLCQPILYNQVFGKKVLATTDKKVLVEIGGAEDWDQTVRWTLEQGWGGLENLALIPGTVGAAPVQNIGAYGVELSSLIHSVLAWDKETQSEVEFSAESCDFAYRDSVFKRQPGRWFIHQVRLHLTPLEHHQLNLDYKPLATQNLTSAQAVYEAVTSIRTSKLPDPKKIGNAGSFFCNPIVEREVYESLQKSFPDLPAYPQKNGGYKISAAFLIQSAGWRGFRQKDAGVHEQQPLVLVNHGSTTGQEILSLAQSIQADIQQRYGVELVPEVRILQSEL